MDDQQYQTGTAGEYGRAHGLASGGRIGDVSALLRTMRPLHSVAGAGDVDGRRRLLADIVRLIGRSQFGDEPTLPSPPPPPPTVAGLTPRLEQTLRCLLDGDSEKQVAQRLQLSPHTVHVYVKALYRRFDVRSRGELLALHVRR